MNLNTAQKILLGTLIGGVVGLSVLFLGFNKTGLGGPRDVTLTVWGVVDAQDELQHMFSSFNDYLHGIKGYENVEVTFTYRKWSEDEYEDILVNQIAEGEGPDIFFIHNTWVPKHHKKLVAAPEWVTNPDLVSQTFVPVVREDMEMNGQIFGLPIYVDTLALYYNKNHFRSAEFSDVEPAETWEGIRDQVAKLVINDGSATGIKRAALAVGSTQNITHAVDVLYLLMLQYGAEITDDEFSRATFNDALDGDSDTGPAEMALQIYSGFSNTNFSYYTWNKDYLTDLDIEYDRNEIDAFVEQQVSMIFGYSEIYEELEARGERSRSGLSFDVTSVPQLEDPEETGLKTTFAEYWAPAVSRNSQNWDVAWLFISHATSNQQAYTYNTNTHRPPSRLDLVEIMRGDEKYGLWAMQAKDAARSLKLFDQHEADIVFTQVIDDVVDREISIQDAIQDAVSRMDEILYTYYMLQ